MIIRKGLYQHYALLLSTSLRTYRDVVLCLVLSSLFHFVMVMTPVGLRGRLAFVPEATRAFLVTIRNVGGNGGSTATAVLAQGGLGLTPHLGGEGGGVSLDLATPQKTLTAEGGETPDMTVTQGHLFDNSLYYAARELDQSASPLSPVPLSFPSLGARDRPVVRILLFVSERGVVDNFRIEGVGLDSPYALVVIGAFKNMGYSPGEIAGVAVKSQLLIEVSFSPEEPWLEGAKRNTDEPDISKFLMPKPAL